MMIFHGTVCRNGRGGIPVESRCKCGNPDRDCTENTRFCSAMCGLIGTVLIHPIIYRVGNFFQCQIQMSIEVQWLFLHNLSNSSADILRNFFAREKSQIYNLWRADVVEPRVITRLCTVYQTVDCDFDFLLQLLFRKIDEDRSSETDPNVRIFHKFCESDLLLADHGNITRFLSQTLQKIEELLEYERFVMEVLEGWMILVNILPTIPKNLFDCCFEILTKISNCETVAFRNRLAEDGKLWKIFQSIQVEDIKKATNCGELLLSIVKDDKKFGDSANQAPAVFTTTFVRQALKICYKFVI